MRVIDKALEARIARLLPPLYRERYQELTGKAMGTAGLKYDSDGRVAWGEMWGSFCDLALAGGPAHRGTWLGPGSAAEIAADEVGYAGMVAEICRGVGLVTGLWAGDSGEPGWVRMDCTSAAMAGWMARAMTTENVAARFAGLRLLVPAGPGFRVEKEVKNVLTAVAKTAHYWLEHTGYEERLEIGAALREMDAEGGLIEPAWDGLVDEGAVLAVAEEVERATGMRALGGGAAGWAGWACADVRAAIGLMRRLVAGNVMARREGVGVWVPGREGVVDRVVVALGGRD